ncbi:hypothetical protein QNH48_05970 [Neobacillus sp. YX16]|uniref:hypothetical protein n=1 Tax=Neobacillus sp. YX16 TaxID=3047874 RepID=UPI0024C38813|nr:hypothetical protein [Neobacillus sp. YX16]WHZ04199.1 hypothetical protein QNH48_05970 [Neobacillus sp. YX16]
MSFPNIPNITPLISVTTGQTISLLLSSIALEELALAHIINAEAEKLQFVLGTLDDTGVTFSPAEVSIEDLLDVNTRVRRTLRDVIKKEMLLEFKFENVLDLMGTLPSEPVLLEQQTFTFTGEIQTTTVPTGATTARIQAIGAQGGNEENNNTVGGLGASVQGEFGVTPGESLAVLVGGMGGTDFGGGGGGGSFVWRGTVPGDLNASSLLVAAGGGGGAGSNFFSLGNNGADASIAFITTIGPGTPANPAGGTVGLNGTGGGGGTTVQFGAGGGGAGVFASGGTSNGGGGQAINSGGAGGAAGGNGGPGGFGGGGGGGGSRNNGTNQNNSAGAGFGNGQVIISFFGS